MLDLADLKKKRIFIKSVLVPVEYWGYHGSKTYFGDR